MRKLAYIKVVLMITALFFVFLSCDTTTVSRNKDDKNKVTDKDMETEDGDVADVDTADCDGTNDGDADVPNGVISKIQKGELAVNTEVSFDCVITAIVYVQDESFNNTAIKGFYVSELVSKARPYSGIYIFVRDTAEIEAFSPGDHIDIQGIYKEYFGNSQVEVTTGTITKIGTADIPEPADIDDPSKVATPFVDTGSGWTPGMEHGEDASKYESVLIRVSDVEITNSNLGHGAFELTGNLAVDKQIHYYTGSRDVGEMFKYVTGILIYAYDAYRIAPRSDDDFIEKDDESEDEDSDENSDEDQYEKGMIEKIRQGDIQENTDVTVECVITGIVYNQDVQFNNTSIKGFYVSEIIPVALPYTGIYVFVSGTAPVDAYEIGDRVEVTGKYKEFFGSSQIETTNIKITKNGKADVPEPALITDTSKVATPFVPDGENWKPGTAHGEDAEKYESVLIKVENIKITNSNLGHGTFELTGSLAVDKMMHYYAGKRDVDKEFDEITGVLIYSYNAFRIAPRMAEDLVEKAGE